MAKNSGLDPQNTLNVFLKNHKNRSATARELGVHRRTIDRHLEITGIPKITKEDKPLFVGTIQGKQYKTLDLPAYGEVKRYIFTSAQNNTYVHEEFFTNLLAFADHMNAELHVSRFRYNVHAQDDEVKPETVQDNDFEGLFYDPRLEPYFSDERLMVATGLMWVGDMNILPTAVRPLSGFETFTGRASGIFPHAKIALESIPSMPEEPTKFNYTTGAITQRNYIQRKAGLKSEFHHSFSCLLVEVTSTGNWYVRQLNATDDGSFYDLDKFVNHGKVTSGHRLEALNPGDIHVTQIDPVINNLIWGAGGMFETLRPKYQFLHDLLDMKSRNHHDRDNCHSEFTKYERGEDNVANEVLNTAVWLRGVSRDWCTSVVVESNHDQHLTRWLREANFKTDHPNAIFYLENQLKIYESIRDQDKNFHLVEYLMTKYGKPLNTKFLREDESFIICHDRGGGIECGIHGHNGPNGSRGSPAGFVRLGRKANTGHSHSAFIRDGVYGAGTCSKLRLSYNKGQSSWSHSLIATLPNAKRQIITPYNGLWRA